jgi:hypothetical protein
MLVVAACRTVTIPVTFDAVAREDRAPDAPADAALDAPPPDASALDASTLDASRPDATDAPDVTEAAVDLGPPYDPCAPAAVRDLDALGTRTGATTRVVGDNLLVGRMGPLPSPCAVGMTGHQVVYRYTPRATTRLLVSTNDEATDARLDTVVFVLSACGPLGDGGASSLGCSDDTGDPPRDHASTFVTDANVTAGAPVYVVVAGFLHATRELFESQGRFALSVTEL